MRKRQVIRMLLACTLLFGATGCGDSFLASEDGAGGSPPPDRDKALSFRQETLEDLPDRVKERWTESGSAKTREGIRAEIREEGRTYLFLSTGKRSTGGWSIRVNEVVQKGAAVQVNAEEVPPPKGSFNTQAITSPVTVISLKPHGDVRFNCRITKADRSDQGKEQMPPRDDPEVKTLPGKVEAAGTLPATVKAKVEEVKKSGNGGGKSVSHEDRTYLIIGLGERRTGGYRVNVNNIVRRNGEIHVYAEEVTPGSGTMVTQVISHPVQVVSIPESGDAPIHFHVRGRSSSDQPDR